MSKGSENYDALAGLFDPIPIQFQQGFFDGYFQSCQFCQCNLLDDRCNYIINKSYVDHQLVYEIAMCVTCKMELNKAYSKESIESINKLFPWKDILEKRMDIILADVEKKYEVLTDSCTLCNEKKENLANYYEYAFCNGKDLVYYHYPYLLCETCGLKIYTALSKKTINAVNEYFYSYFGAPPEWSKKEHNSILLFL
jgi:hypothetical protein